jgi:hypothetical protein
MMMGGLPHLLPELLVHLLCVAKDLEGHPGRRPARRKCIHPLPHLGEAASPEQRRLDVYLLPPEMQLQLLRDGLGDFLGGRHEPDVVRKPAGLGVGKQVLGAKPLYHSVDLESRVGLGHAAARRTPLCKMRRTATCRGPRYRGRGALGAGLTRNSTSCSVTIAENGWMRKPSTPSIKKMVRGPETPQKQSMYIVA